MTAVWAAMVAAGAAILSSALTSYLTHRFERRRQRKEYELKWLQERFEPALDFLAKVTAIVGSSVHSQEGRERIADDIQDYVSGPAKHKHAFCVAVLLDPENTGLQGYILPALTYARIRDSEKELLRYYARLHMSLEVLAEEYRTERRAILSGKSLDDLIAERKKVQEESSRKFDRAMELVRSFLDGHADLETTIGLLKKARVRSKELGWALWGLSGATDPETKKMLEKLRHEGQQHGWVFEDPVRSDQSNRA